MHEVFKGRVVLAQSRSFVLAVDGERIPALVPKRLRFENPEWVDPVAVGDEVEASYERGQAVIRQVLPRRNQLTRRALHGSKRQLLAANVDHALIVLAMQDPEWKPATLDRYLVLASACDIPALLWLNKSDLVAEAPHTELLPAYEAINVPVFRGSARTGTGVDLLRDSLAGNTSILIGPSGAGKSSLVNQLVPNATARVGEVSASTRKGVHVTSWVEMHELPPAGRIIDGPGLRTLDLSDVAVGDLARHFPEIQARADQCRFPDCAHMAEPDCAVKEAAAGGAIPPHRYESYQRIYRSLHRGEG
ncbi:MAG TPA: ribosome small subunit-dependent GTPase A [Candidatus Eisenbacteria bacterium]|nr:ribosome small subunit-dependent GTPase A [Candidatus Eisenbacteria bacterium]